MLHEFLDTYREELIARCRAKVAKRNSPRVTETELEHGIPLFLTQLGEILRKEILASNADSPSGILKTTGAVTAVIAEAGESAGSHGNELLRKGFTVDQVVLDYGDLCQAVNELAIERHAAITVNEFRILNRSLDYAIAGAVSSFQREHARVIAEATEHTTNDRLGFLADEFHNLINTAMLAVDAIKRGNVGIAGPTGAILERALKGLRVLTDRGLVDVRLSSGIPKIARVLVSEFIEEAQVPAAIEAKARGFEFVVSVVEPGMTIEVDRQILTGALANLLQNAFRFAKPPGTVSLTVSSTSDRVLIDVEDECGGLPSGNAEDLFRPFERRSGDQSGFGLGLGISRRGVEANGGTLSVRNLPGKGCVFTIDLPKATPTLVLVWDSTLHQTSGNGQKLA